VPRWPVVNRRRDKPYVAKVMFATPDAIASATSLAERLRVSLGSVIDTGLLALSDLPDDEVIELMCRHGNLSEEEAAQVRGYLTDI
jgi:hypothetical protein